MLGGEGFRHRVPVSPHGPPPGEGAVLLLNEARDHNVREESESRERTLEICVRTAIADEYPELRIVPAGDFRRAFFPGRKFGDTRRSVEPLLAFLGEEGSGRRVEELGIRYVVVVESDTGSYGERWDFDADNWMWAVGKFWTRRSTLTAFVIDVRQAARSGAIISHSEGEAGYVIPFFVIVPLPPIPWFAPTESAACSGLGVAVARFLDGREGFE